MSNIKITNAIQNKICVLIMTWQGKKFGWAELIKAIKSEIGIDVTRQTLKSDQLIYTKYKAKKQGDSGINTDSKLVGSSEEQLIREIQKLNNKINTLKAKNELAEETTSNQLAFIENMLENARNMGVDLQRLVKPRE